MLVLSFPPSTTPNLTRSQGGWMGNQAGNSEQRKEDETVFLAHASAYASTSASTSASASAAVFAYTYVCAARTLPHSTRTPRCSLVVVVVAVVVPDELAVFRTKYCNNLTASLTDRLTLSLVCCCLSLAAPCRRTGFPCHLSTEEPHSSTYPSTRFIQSPAGTQP